MLFFQLLLKLVIGAYQSITPADVSVPAASPEPYYHRSIEASYQKEVDFDGNARKLSSASYVLLDPADDGGKTDKDFIKIAQVPGGIMVGGLVPGREPDWAQTTNALHITVQDVRAPQFPVVGWGNQFGWTAVFAASDCPAKRYVQTALDCQDWYALQQSYREQLQKLFIYDWQVTPTSSQEVGATAAWQSLQAQGAVPNDALAPPTESGVQMKTATQDNSYTFEVLIPWSALPPQSSLTLDQLQLHINVPQLAVNTSLLVALQKPQHYQLGVCQADLIGVDEYGQQQPAYYRPTADTMLTAAFYLGNHIEGYAYDVTGWSPEVQPVTYTQQQIGDQEFMCGPYLGYARGKLTNHLYQWPPIGSTVEIAHDGDALFIKNTNYTTRSPFGAGMCGGCGTIKYQIYRIDASGAITKTLDGAVYLGEIGVFDGDMGWSDNGRTVTRWTSYQVADEGPPLSWTREQFCYSETTGVHEACGKDAVPPSEPRQFDWKSLPDPASGR